MRFNSHLYLAFLAVGVLVYWSLPARARRVWLLGLSLAFYGTWDARYLALLVAISALNWLGARWIASAPTRDSRRVAWVVAGNLLVLGSFKYLPWLSATLFPIPALDEFAGRRWALPLGISFWTFEAISFVVDVSRRREKPRSFLDYQLFIGFFPKLVAGPILRARELFPQLDRPRGLDPRQLRAGLRDLVSGLFLKVVLADNLAGRVDDAFSVDPTCVGFVGAWTMAAAFSIQLYFDFSGYTRIAIGSARLLGFELVENFDYPYASLSPPDTWRRWNMSLSRWIRDYVHHPLLLRLRSAAGEKLSEKQASGIATIVSMSVFGIWHGAGWRFLAWGLYRGASIAIYNALEGWYETSATLGRISSAPWARPLHTRPMRVLGLSGRWVLARVAAFFGSFLFRANDLSDALVLMGQSLDPTARGSVISPSLTVITLLGIAGATIASFVGPDLARLMKQSDAVQERDIDGWVLAGLDGLAIGVELFLVLLYLTDHTAFVYFQF